MSDHGDGIDINKVIALSEAGAIQAMYELAVRVMERAAELAPPTDPDEDPNPLVSLKESGRIEKDHRGFVIVFETPYAAKVHEDLTAKHPRGGGPKYLERAIKEIVPVVGPAMATGVAAMLRRGSVVRSYERSTARVRGTGT